jgi:hypothetical protein
MHPVTLRFDGGLEAEFAHEYTRDTIGVVRVGLALALGLYCVFGILDTWIAPAQRQALWLIRYVIVAPVLIVCLGLSVTSAFDRYRRAAIFLVALLLAFGIVAMTSIIPPPGSYLYYAGLLLVIMYTFGLTRLSLMHATIAVLITIGAYLTVAILVNPTAPALVVNNVFFLVSALIIGFSSNYAIERYARTNFLQRRLIALRTMELEEKNAQLVVKNRMLAESRAETVRTAQRSELIFSALSDALPGTVLDDKYRVAEKIGSGAFGTVYRGEHISLHHPVAIKVFRPTVGSSGVDGLERFRLEGISACRINHPNAVTVLDFAVAAGSLAYLVMELLQGQSLAEEIKASGPLEPRRALQVAAAVCDVLAEAHASGIVHRDVKPSNIFLHQVKGDELVKVIDFGIAKVSYDIVPIDEAATATVAGMLVGTPAYMSPERLNGDAYDGRADVYAVGVVLYEMLTGRVPFKMGKDVNYWRLAMMITTQAAVPPSMVNAAVPPWLDALVIGALEKDPAHRSSASELADALRSAEMALGG